MWHEPSRWVVDDAIMLMKGLNPAILGSYEVHRRAATMAVELNHHLFDTLYHAVALETGATLVTADERYFVKAQGIGNILLLRDFKLPAGA